ncbi:MAG TPA: hypothetical protein EYP14_11810 [Planctomycetaceae bacterium]|nr:hypothetical protein [Planctomycetaceae bacterium]
MGTASPVTCRRSIGRFMQWDGRLPDGLVEALWRDPDALLGGGSVVSAGKRCTVARVAWPRENASDAAKGPSIAPRCGSQQAQPPGGDRTAVRQNTVFALKRFNQKGPLHTVIHWFLPTRAWRGWRFGRRLQQEGIATPWPWAYVENRLGPLRWTSYLLTEYVTGEPLQRWIDRADQIPRSEWELVIRQFGDLWRRMAKLGVVHGDMKATNFLIDAERRLWVLDLDGMRRPLVSWIWSRARARDEMRFLRNFGNRRDLIDSFRTQIQEKRSAALFGHQAAGAR